VKFNVAMRWMPILLFGAVALAMMGYSDALSANTARSEQVDNYTKSGHTYHLDDMGSDCVDCHAMAEESVSATDRLFPDHDTCFECHDDYGAPQDCETCHTDPDMAAAAGTPARRVDYFNHSAHLNMDLGCQTCHERSGESEAGQIVFSMPPMETCSECHNGVKAADECETCHSSVSMGDLLPGSHMIPEWSRAHSSVARDDASMCASCHVQEQDCDMCHRGDNLSGIPHREGFVDSHPFSFYSKDKECASCHEIQDFCVSCHQARRAFPTNHSFGDWTARHGDFAETDLESCAACHDDSEPTCANVGCHAGI
jgi:c(7)-type cytochrome triheme protein